MPTQWTNTVTVDSPILAADILEVRDAVDTNRLPYNVPPPFPWTDPGLPAGTPVKAVHFTELRIALEDLAAYKSITLPGWTQGAPASGSPIRASHLTDLRAWLNQYELNPTGALYSPLRGLHLRNGADMRSIDVTAAKWFDPRMVVVLSSDLLVTGRTNLIAYLASLSSATEIYCRYQPSTFPSGDYLTVVDNYGPGGTGKDWLRNGAGQIIYSGGAAIQRNPPEVAQDIIDIFDRCIQQLGLEITRFYVGNEPELEWLNDVTRPQYLYHWHLWRDLNAYYREVYYQFQLVKGSRPIELMPPAFVASAFVGIGQYLPDGSVVPLLLDDGKKGADWVRNTIEYYTNGTNVGSVCYTNYFYPGRQQSQVAFNYFPDWLKEHITLHGYVSKITEWGWFPASFEPPCSVDLDFTGTPCEALTPSLHSWSDYSDFARNWTMAGGAAMWLLSTVAGGLFEKQAGVTNPSSPDDGVIRTWFKDYVAYLNAAL